MAAKKKGAEAVDSPVGSEAEYKRFLPLAQALKEAEVTVFRADPQLAFYNVRTGIESLLLHREELRKALPLMDQKAVFELPELAQALIFATTKVGQDQGGEKAVDTRALLKEATALRGLLLSSAEALAMAGVLPERTVQKIRAGRGAIDAARDCVELAALYRENKEALRKSPISAEQLRRAAEVGTALLGVLKPRSGKAKPAGANPASSSPTDIRDRLGTLLWKRHRELRKAGYWIWGDDFDRYVPPLLGRKVKKPAAKPPAGSTPTPTP